MKKRKVLAILMACVITVLAFGSPVSAAYVGNIVQVNDSTYRIPENVAEIMASFFIRDMQMVPDNTWTEDTIVADSQVMYDTDGSVSAYSFELATDGEPAGYVVISAYPNLENKILEFSDVSEPVYSEFSLSNGDEVVYTGPLGYYKDSGGAMLETVDSTYVSRSAVTNVWAQMEAQQIAEKASVASIQSEDPPGEEGYPITDPFEFAEYFYKVPFESYEYINEFESYCHYRINSDFNGYFERCGPTAITNLIEMIGDYRGYSSVNTNYINIFENVAQYGIANGYFESNVVQMLMIFRNI